MSNNEAKSDLALLIDKFRMPEADTKQFVNIEDVKENIVMLKDGSLRGIIEVDAVNFELKSQAEQTAIILKFQEFLNSLDFSVQISIISRKVDLKEYLKNIDEITEKIANDLIRLQAVEYSRFIKGLLELSNIMSKIFYVVVPFYLIEKQSGVGILKSVKEIVKPAETVRKMTEEDFTNYKTQLEQRIEFVSNGLLSMGLRAKQLQSQELANLYYRLFNPEAKEEITI